MTTSSDLRAASFSWLRIFLAAILTAVLTSITTGDWYWLTILFAGLVSTLPVIINWLNPNDPRYGHTYFDKEEIIVVDVDEDDTEGMAG